MTTRYLIVSAVSGCAWGGLAYVLGREWLGPAIWGGIMASPLIGMVVAVVYRPIFKRSPGWRIFLALVTLYLATLLFGLAAGVYDAIRPMPPGVHRLWVAVILQTVLATWWAITFTGLVLLLWPLSYLNHWLIGRYGSPEKFSARYDE